MPVVALALPIARAYVQGERVARRQKRNSESPRWGLRLCCTLSNPRPSARQIKTRRPPRFIIEGRHAIHCVTRAFRCHFRRCCRFASARNLAFSSLKIFKETNQDDSSQPLFSI